MKPWLRQGIWLALALIAPVLLSLALLPLRGHVSDVLIALVLLTVSARWRPAAPGDPGAHAAQYQRPGAG